MLRGVIYSVELPSTTVKGGRHLADRLRRELPEKETSAASEKGGNTVEEMLQAELAELTGPKRAADFARYDITRGMGFVRFCDKEIATQPSEMCRNLLKQAKAEGSFSPFVCRMIPVDFACSPHVKQFRALCAKHLQLDPK